MSVASDRKWFFDEVKKGGLVSVGEFKNKHGEQFVMYQMRGIPGFFVTGDELDWELGWQFEQYDRELTQRFTLTEEESEALNTIYIDRKRPVRK